MDMRTLIAAGMTGTLMLGGIGAAVAVSHDTVAVPEEVEDVVEVPQEVEDVVEVPEEVEDVVEVPEEVEDVVEVPEDEARAHPDNFGARVSADARGESDGVRGVDGRQISAEAKAKATAKRTTR